MQIGIGVGLTILRSRPGFVGAYDNTPSIVAAYGMRRLRSAYTGSLLRLRRSSDNAEQDFGYNANGDLDTAAIATFVGAGSGFVTTWYDQSGNGRNATQATAVRQPLYVASGQNNRPVIRWGGTAWMEATYGGGSAYTALVVAKLTPTGGLNRILIQLRRSASITPIQANIRAIADAQVWNLSHRNDANTSVGVTGAALTADWLLHTAQWNGSQITLWRNGVASDPVAASGTTTVDTLYLGRPWESSAQFLWPGDMAELVIANAAWSTDDRQAAEQAANSYWAVY